jgi:hypothetical protein
MIENLMRLWLWTLSLLFVSFAACAQAEDKPALPPSDSHGAVLCIWSIYVQLKDFGTVCSLDPNSGLQPLLNESIARMDKFITDNSDITQKQLDDKKKELLASDQEKAAKSDKDELQKICTGDGQGGVPGAYKKLQATDPERIRQAITKLLEIPRKPVMDPCI